MNKKNRSLRNQQGLTLIEALAVFIIFAIIMLILYSGFVTARKVTSKGDLWQSRENAANNVIEGKEEADISVTNQKGGLITLQFGEKAVSFPGTYVLAEDPDNPAVTLMAYQEMAGFDANNVYEAMMNTIRLYSTLTPEERKILGLNYPNNDLYRKFILKEKYGGNWPAISDKFIEEHGIILGAGQHMYIQAYYLPKSPADISDPENASVFVYANPYNVAVSQWFGYLIYDHEERCWYEAPKDISGNRYKTLNLVGKTWADVKTIIHDPTQGWTQLG